MKNRIEKLGGTFHFPIKEKIGIDVAANIFSKGLIAKIHCKDVQFNVAKNSKNSQDCDIEFNSSAEVPLRMDSKLARPWTHDFRLTLLLSARGISVGS